MILPGEPAPTLKDLNARPRNRTGTELVQALRVISPLWLLVVITRAAEGQWRASVEKDEITDVRTATFRLAAHTLTRGPIGTSVRPSLSIRCSQGSVTDLLVYVETFVTDDDPVLLRFDGQPAISSTWNPSTSNRALFAPDQVSILDSILVHDRMLFGFTPYREGDETTSFRLAGLSVHDGLLKPYCGFTVQERRRMIREGRTEAGLLAAKERADAVARARAQAAADSLKELATPSRDTTLPWVSRFSHDFYYKNTPACKKLLDVHVTWIVFWPTEEGAVASNRRRSNHPGC